ncbi:MAG: BON domain-containing protein, partial [Thermoanaerobaculia bacterium]
MEPVGNYAIHIVVKGGRVGLFGNVSSEADKARAGQVARSVFGVLDVDNEIQVVSEKSREGASGPGPLRHSPGWRSAALFGGR